MKNDQNNGKCIVVLGKFIDTNFLTGSKQYSLKFGFINHKEERLMWLLFHNCLRCQSNESVVCQAKLCNIYVTEK